MVKGSEEVPVPVGTEQKINHYFTGMVSSDTCPYGSVADPDFWPDPDP